MHIAIVDDSPRDSKQINTYISRFCKENGVSASCSVFSAAKDFLRDYQSNFDLVIMDIDMPGLNGVEAARLLRKTDSNVVLMFVTNMPQYSLCGYEVEAVDYVLKPVSYGDFALKLKKAIRYVRRNRDEKIAIRTADGMVHLPVRSIFYVESALHYLIYHTEEGDYRVRSTMGEAKQMLQGQQFARCNTGYLVNLRYVEAIEREDVLVSGVRLKMSRGKRAEFFNTFSRFLGGTEP